MCRQFPRQCNDVEEVQKSESRASLRLVDSRGKPFAPQQLLSMRDPLIATTEVDGDVMEAVGVQDDEILMTCNR